MLLVQVGGSSGIGLSTVKHFLRKGVKPCIADINEKTGRAAQEELKNLGHEVGFVALDITSNESIQAGIKSAADILGVIDFAVNTAGITGPMTPMHELEDDQYYKITRIDMDGCFKFMKYILQYFRAQEPRFIRHDEGVAWEPVYQRGSLVNLASSIATVCQPLLGAYCRFDANVTVVESC